MLVASHAPGDPWGRPAGPGRSSWDGEISLSPSTPCPDCSQMEPCQDTDKARGFLPGLPAPKCGSPLRVSQNNTTRGFLQSKDRATVLVAAWWQASASVQERSGQSERPRMRPAAKSRHSPKPAGWWLEHTGACVRVRERHRPLTGASPTPPQPRGRPRAHNAWGGKQTQKGMWGVSPRGWPAQNGLLHTRGRGLLGPRARVSQLVGTGFPSKVAESSRIWCICSMGIASQ